MSVSTTRDNPGLSRLAKLKDDGNPKTGLTD